MRRMSRRRIECQAAERHDTDLRKKFLTFYGYKNYVEAHQRAIADGEDDNLRRVEGGAATRHVKIEVCFAVYKTGAFSNIEEYTTRRTARRSSRRKKQRVGTIQKERVLSVLIEIRKATVRSQVKI